MKKHAIFLSIFCIVLALLLTGCSASHEKLEGTKIVTSFYPMYIITLNLTKDIPDVSLENMTDASIGCLHNYSLQTQDLKKIENAKVFIKNGLGLENFIDKITQVYPNLNIIDASNADLEILQDEDGDNGHIWNSLENYKKQVKYICEKLINYDIKNEETYRKNENEYLQRIDSIKNYKVEKEEYTISCNEALAYLLNEVNLKVIPVYTDHDESSLSSRKLTEAIDMAREKQIKVIFVDKNDNLSNAQLIAKETGAKIVELDAILTGNLDKDAYINAMNDNYKKIREIFEN